MLIEMSSVPSAQNLFAIDGLVAIVTGGGSGIGEMIARALSANGASAVYILGLPDDPLEDVAKQSVRAYPINILRVLSYSTGPLQYPSHCL